MTTKDINCDTNNFWNQLVRECNFSEIKTPKERQEARIAKFNEILHRINTSEKDSEILPFLKVVLCYRFVVENVYTCEIAEKVFGHKSEIDYNEIADYLTTVIADIKYVAVNDKSDSGKQIAIFSGSRKGVNACVIHALAECCSNDVMRTFMESIVNVSYNSTIEPITKIDFFARAIHEYALKKDYQSMVEYGEMMIDLFKKDNVYSSLSEQPEDFLSEIKSINEKLDIAFKTLGKSNLAQEALLDSIKYEEERETIEEQIKKIKKSLLKSIEDLPDEGERISKFDELLKVVENQPQKEKSIFRVEVCYTYAKVLYERFKKSNAISYNELAGYLSLTMSDIEYVAANDVSRYADYQRIYRIGDHAFISYIVEAIADCMPEDSIKRFVGSVVIIESNKNKLENIVNYFCYVIHRYIKDKKYKEVADYAKWFMKVYKEKEGSCTYLGVYDFKKTVDAIHSDIDIAYKALNIQDEEHEVKMVDIRKRAAETPQEAQNRERAELYDQAQRSRAQGDDAGYCGNMSAFGDVGR